MKPPTEPFSKKTEGSHNKVLKVPVINLLEGAPDMGDAEIKRWTEAEKAAFEGTQAWDEEAQLSLRLL